METPSFLRQRLIARRDELIALLSDPDVLHELSEVLAALARIEAGTFGVCLACGGPIDREVLDAEPAIRCCGECEITGEIHTGGEYVA